MKKRSATLIEMIIALGLLSFLLSSLFIWHYQIIKSREDVRKFKQILLQERFTQQRLERIFSKTAFESTNRQTAFCTSDKPVTSLIFTFDNGPQREPLLSSYVLARLYHDLDERSLCLGIWPLPDQGEPPRETPFQKLVLLENVTELKLDFYSPPDPFQNPVNPEEVGSLHPHEGWQKIWLMDYQQLPALVKISLEQESQEKVEFVYDLSNRITLLKT